MRLNCTIMKSHGAVETHCRKEWQMRENLRKARMKAGLTQADVARLAGLGLRQYKAIEYGESNGSVDVWKRLRSIFRKPIDYLLEQEED